MNTPEIKKTLKQFRTDREELLEATTKTAWREWITSPYFWFYWSMSNIRSSDITDVAEWVLTNPDAGEYWDVADTIKSVYTDPVRWIQNNNLDLKTMIERHGQPE